MVAVIETSHMVLNYIELIRRDVVLPLRPSTKIAALRVPKERAFIVGKYITTSAMGMRVRGEMSPWQLRDDPWVSNGRNVENIGLGVIFQLDF
jgi:hypothetical protein